MYRFLLVPLDGSTFAEHALPAAVAIARRAGATLHLVTVCPPLAEAYTEGIYIDTTDLMTDLLKRQQAYLDSVASRIKERADITVTTQVGQGEVGSVLCHLAEEKKANLVVLATHGRSALGRFWLGSVADEMVRHSTTPLLLVRPQEEKVDLAVEPDLSKILIALDGTDLSEQILEPAIQLGGLMADATFLLMRAIKPVGVISGVPDVPEADREARHLLTRMQEMQARVYDETARYLESQAGKLQQRGLKVGTRVVVEDEPVQAILHQAENERAGVIALETHGRRGLSRLVLGSLADKVIRGSHVPVLVQKGKE